MNIIILTDSDRIKKSDYILKDERFKHIRKILKSNLGDIIEIGLLNGPIGKAIISELTDEYVKLETFDLIKTSEPFPLIDLICALPRPQTVKKILNTSATMGINKIYFIRAEKVEKSFYQSPLLMPENYNKYLVEGLSQGKRTKMPEIIVHKRFKEFIGTKLDKSKYDLMLLAQPENSTNLMDQLKLPAKHILVAVGPEGGWNDFEIDYFKNNGFVIFNIGNWILRVENAVTAILAQIELIKHSTSE